MEQQRIFPTGPIGRSLTVDLVIDRINAFDPEAVDIRGDHDLNKNTPDPLKKQRDAAVLIPIVRHDDELSVLLTKRTDHLKHHPGQISFPGGRTEDSDPSPVHAALRETHEEVGVTEDYITVLGRMGDYITGTGFRVVPVVGLVEPTYPVNVDEFEVAEVFEVPLSFLMDRNNHERHSREFKGQTRHFWAIPYNDYYIWGATAGMLLNLCDILEGKA
jgi:8-oxo-dGTP pyrophosphatase MutT (NUDIX family)